MRQEPDTVRRQIVDAALALTGDATFEHVFKALTPERIADEAPPAASTVRYHFGPRVDGDDRGPGQLAFQRRDLALAMLDTALGDADDAKAAAHRAATEALLASGSTEGILAAIAALHSALLETLRRELRPGRTPRPRSSGMQTTRPRRLVTAFTFATLDVACEFPRRGPIRPRPLERRCSNPSRSGGRSSKRPSRNSRRPDSSRCSSG